MGSGLGQLSFFQKVWRSAQFLKRDLTHFKIMKTAFITLSLMWLMPLGILRSAEPRDWQKQALEDAKHDRTSIPYDGVSPNKMVCDTTLRLMPDGSWIISMLAGDDFEPSPKNYIG